MNKVISLLGSYRDALMDFLAPRICLNCSEKINEDNYKYDFLCSACYNKLPFHDSNQDISTRLIGLIPNEEIQIDRALALIDLPYNENYMNIVYAFKYQNYRKVAYQMGEEIGKYLKYNELTNIDAIVPIPLHIAKKRERGYNQAELIARGIANIIEVPVDTKSAKRKIYTESQTLQERQDRLINTTKAFYVERPENIVGKRILICDDVFTTGSTINSLACVLKSAGAKGVFSVTLVAA